MSTTSLLSPAPVFAGLKRSPVRKDHGWIRCVGWCAQTPHSVNVRDVAEANVRAATTPLLLSGAFNIGSATRITINRLAALLTDASGMETLIRHEAPRKGDVRDSLADISAATAAFGYRPAARLEEGLREYMEWIGREHVPGEVSS